MANPRRTHRKRISALRLSSDTTNTLPEYWRELVPPPEYEADADGDADDDTDGDNEPPAPYIPPGAVSPRRRMQHRRKPSSPLPQDAFIDSLLERSVHALELSNALLQSSMTPTTSAFKDPSPTKSTPAPIPMPPARDESWAEDLAKIAQDVDELLVSSSLPPAPSPIAHRRPRRRPSLDTTTTSSRRSSYLSSSSASSAMPTTSHASDNGLRMAGQTRSRFIAHAPRAMTQYIDAETAHDDLDEETISLPSTLGLRAAASDWRIAESKPVVSTTTHSPEPSTPAYHMLSSFVHPRATSPKIATGPRSSSRGRAATRGGSRSSSRGGSHTPRRTGTPDGLPLPESSSPLLGQRSSPGASIIARLPSETLGHSPQSSDDGGDGSADGCRAKEARSALRRILEEAPPPPPPVRSASRKFQPRTPSPVGPRCVIYGDCVCIAAFQQRRKA
ncbi:hypothetical protein MKEN_00139900 [Mycena kentingensis (nom. inval.)]|nr:hypothetical protein MKEN_00139900 [Mycena kentingensis (nom. inval.)]